MTAVPAGVRARRLAYRVAWRIAGAWWFVRRPHTHGVKLLVVDGDRALFVRHSYGERDAWELPAGGRRRGESALEAARREAAEELGLRITEWVEAGLLVDRIRATANLTCLVAAWDGTPIRLDPVELTEHRWAPLSAPPQPLGRLGRGTLALPGVPAAVAAVSGRPAPRSG